MVVLCLRVSRATQTVMSLLVKAGLFGGPGDHAAPLPDISWVPPALLCFADPTSSEMAPDAPGGLWCPCLPLPS